MIKIIAKNKKASYNYEIIDTYEAGISLLGSEVKSIKAGKISIEEGWVDFKQNQAILKQVMISDYGHYSSALQLDKLRPRTLLLQSKQIKKLTSFVLEKGFSVIPVQIYLKNGLVKVKIACVRGKKLYDKRQASKKKDANKKITAALKYKQRNNE